MSTHGSTVYGRAAATTPSVPAQRATAALPSFLMLSVIFDDEDRVYELGRIDLQGSARDQFATLPAELSALGEAVAFSLWVDLWEYHGEGDQIVEALVGSRRVDKDTARRLLGDRPLLRDRMCSARAEDAPVARRLVA